MLKKLFGLDNDKISGFIRSVMIGIGAVLGTLGIVGGEEWALFSENINTVVGSLLAAWYTLQSWLSKDRPVPEVPAA